MRLPGGGKRKKKRNAGKREKPAAAELDPELPALWDCTVQVEAERLDGLLATFTAREKAVAATRVLQLRVDEALG
jgi:hypothetical protein